MSGRRTGAHFAWTCSSFLAGGFPPELSVRFFRSALPPKARSASSLPKGSGAPFRHPHLPQKPTSTHRPLFYWLSLEFAHQRLTDPTHTQRKTGIERGIGYAAHLEQASRRISCAVRASAAATRTAATCTFRSASSAPRRGCSSISAAARSARWASARRAACRWRWRAS